MSSREHEPPTIEPNPHDQDGDAKPSRSGKFVSGLIAATGVAIAIAVTRGSYGELSLTEGISATAFGIVGGIALILLSDLILKAWGCLFGKKER